MYRISIYNKSKKMVAVYEHVHTIKYIDITGETIIVTGKDILSHFFPATYSYQLLSDDGNYSIDKSIIGTFEVTSPIY